MTTKYDLSFQLVSGFESLLLVAQKDIFGDINIGYGLKKYYNDGTPIKVGDVCTQQQATNWCNWHLVHRVYLLVDKFQEAHPDLFTDKVYAGLSSLFYNCPIAAQGVSINHAINNENLELLCAAFKLYINVNGEPCRGLINRRNAEIDFMKGL